MRPPGRKNKTLGFAALQRRVLFFLPGAANDLYLYPTV